MTRLRAALAAVSVLPALALPVATGPADAAPVHAVEQRPTAYTITGTVVRASNGRPVKGVRVAIYEGDFSSDFYGADLTNARGRFTVDFTAPDDGWGVFVNGSKVGYQSGWVGCDRTLKRTFGAACVHGEDVGTVRVKLG